MQVAELLGMRGGLVHAPQRYGIEIEVERCEDYPFWCERTRWVNVSDGSLRNHGMEFITPPVTYDEAESMIHEYYQYHHMNGYEASIRTGIHVHADMTWRTLTQVSAICTLYALLEPMFFDLCGPEREECIYCVPWYRAPDDAVMLGEMRQENGINHIRRRLESMCKYGALYLEPLRRLGTIEFRAAPTFEDADDMVLWLRTVRRCVALGHYYGTPERVLEAADHNLQRLVNYVFPDRYSADEAEALLEGADSRAVADMIAVVRTTPFRWIHNLDEPQDAAGIYYRHARPTGGRQPMYHLDDEGGMRPLYHVDDELESVFAEDDYDDEEDY